MGGMQTTEHIYPLFLQKGEILMVQRIFSIIVLPLLTLVAIGCSDSTGPADGKGTVRVVMTDAPFPINLVAEANVSIERVEIRSKSADSDSGFTIVTDIDTILNLVDLRNGITAQLGELDLGPGIYDEIRLITGDAEIILTDDTRFDLKVPSGSQTGIKIKIKNDLTVEEGKVVEVLLDFDLSKSFVVKGNPATPSGINGFNFKPVLRAVATAASGRVEGTILEGINDMPLENTYVVLTSQDDNEVYEAYTDDKGYFALIGLPTGLYDIAVSSDDLTTARQADIEVKAGEATTIDLTLMP